MGIICALVSIIGTYILLRILYHVWLCIQEVFLLKELDLLNRYGRGSWAFITGSTDGIGFGFADNLAKRGFNVIICARNPEKLATKKKLLEQKHPKVKFATIQADFSDITNPELAERIAKELEPYDVSILVNNVGLGTKGTAITDTTMESSQRMVVVNCVTPVIMAKIFLERVKERKFRSAIVELSSVANIAPLAKKDIYSATKRFNRHFAMSIQPKVKSLVDYLILKPGFVSTPLTDNREIDALTCDVDGCVNSTLKVLGQRAQTFGHWKHIIKGHLLGALSWIFPMEKMGAVQGFMFKMMKYNVSGGNTSDPYKKNK
jgi:short-subunit dehydrogenase